MMTDFRSCQQQQYADNNTWVTPAAQISVSSYGAYFHPNIAYNATNELDGQYSQFTSSYASQFYQHQQPQVQQQQQQQQQAQQQSYEFDSSSFLPHYSTLQPVNSSYPPFSPTSENTTDRSLNYFYSSLPLQTTLSSSSTPESRSPSSHSCDDDSNSTLTANKNDLQTGSTTNTGTCDGTRRCLLWACKACKRKTVTVAGVW